MQLYYTRMQCTIGSNNQSNLIYIIAVAITIAMFIRTWLAETPGNTRPKKNHGSLQKKQEKYSLYSPTYYNPTSRGDRTNIAVMKGSSDSPAFITTLSVPSPGPPVGYQFRRTHRHFRPHIPPTPLPLFYFCLIFR